MSLQNALGTTLVKTAEDKLKAVRAVSSRNDIVSEIAEVHWNSYMTRESWYALNALYSFTV